MILDVLPKSAILLLITGVYHHSDYPMAKEKGVATTKTSTGIYAGRLPRPPQHLPFRKVPVIVSESVHSKKIAIYHKK